MKNVNALISILEYSPSDLYYYDWPHLSYLLPFCTNNLLVVTRKMMTLEHVATTSGEVVIYKTVSRAPSRSVLST